MTIERIFMWPIIIVCYGALLGAIMHTILGNWSGVVSLGLLFAIPIGIPALVGYAGYLWRKNLLVGCVRIEALICVAYPVFFILVVGFVMMMERSP